jgi:hypothetical protein
MYVVYVDITSDILPYEKYVIKACEFWTKYTGIQFVILRPGDPDPPISPRAGIYINAKFDQDPGYGAETRRDTLNDIHEISSGGIVLYAEWLTYNNTTKWIAIAHEIGHVIFTVGRGIDGQGHTNEGDIMDYRGPTKSLIHTYQQLAIKIQYSKNPGDSI